MAEDKFFFEMTLGNMPKSDGTLKLWINPCRNTSIAREIMVIWPVKASKAKARACINAKIWVIITIRIRSVLSAKTLPIGTKMKFGAMSKKVIMASHLVDFVSSQVSQFMASNCIKKLIHEVIDPIVYMRKFLSPKALPIPPKPTTVSSFSGFKHPILRINQRMMFIEIMGYLQKTVRYHKYRIEAKYRPVNVIATF